MSNGIEIKGFKYVRTLGTGGFATTYLYSDVEKKYGDFVAVKVPHDRAKEESLVKGDIPSLAQLNEEPFIARYIATISAGGRYALVMEYVEGILLRQLLGMPNTAKRLPLEKALKYALQVAQGLDAAHNKKMVHRDIKPENIIIEQAGDTAKILDFGMASVMDRSGSFETEFGGHTRFYTPLEVLIHRRGDHRVDVFSLGMTLYEMLTGTLPYFTEGITEYKLIEWMNNSDPAPLRTKDPAIPLHLEKVIIKAISKRPEDRYQDMQTLIAALEPPRELTIANEMSAGGSIRKAEQTLRVLLSRCPDDSRGYMALANLLNRCHRQTEACDLIKQALEIDPEEPGIHLRLGATLMQLGRKQEAEDALSKAESLSRDKQLSRKIKSLRLALKAGSA